MNKHFKKNSLYSDKALFPNPQISKYPYSNPEEVIDVGSPHSLSLQKSKQLTQKKKKKRAYITHASHSLQVFMFFDINIDT